MQLNLQAFHLKLASNFIVGELRLAMCQSRIESISIGPAFTTAEASLSRAEGEQEGIVW